MPTITSLPSEAVEGSVQIVDWWIGDAKDRDDRGVFLRDVVTFDTSESENLAWFEPIGRKRAVSVATTLMGVKINMTVMFYNQFEYDKLRYYRERQTPVMVLKSPFGEQWFVRFDAVWSVRLRRGEGPQREVSFGFTEVARP